jgi:acyl-CoA thioester hydrolase
VRGGRPAPDQDERLCGVPRFVAQVLVRWTDQDAYRHVNHAKAVTLLEEARVAMIFDAAAEEGVASFGPGLLVVGLHVDYRRQIPYRSDGLRVSMAIEEVRAASFRITYEMHDGPAEADAVAVRAWTRMATFDLDAGRPRRLTPDEREFLDRWTVA